jgi:hypothetical protein
MIKTVLLQLLLAIVTVIASVSAAAAQCTSVGSAGTVDGADVAEFETAGPQMRVRGTATLPATVVIRYNVVSVNGMTGGDGAITMYVRYLDNATGARVLSVLKQVNIQTGVITTMLTLDSNDFAPDSDFQTQGVDRCAVFNFTQNAYFIETTLTKSTPAARPRVMALWAGVTEC